MANGQNEIKKTYAFLISLKKNLPNGKQIKEKYAEIFNNEISRLINLGFTDMEEFKVPNSEIKNRVISYNYITGGDKTYSKDKYVDREILLFKLDAVLTFFDISTPEKEIGFKSNQF